MGSENENQIMQLFFLPITINIDDYSGKTLEKDIPSDIKLFYF